MSATKKRSLKGLLGVAVVVAPRTRNPTGSPGACRLALRVAAAEEEGRIVVVVVGAAAVGSAPLGHRARRRVFRGISCLCGLCSLCRRSRRACLVEGIDWFVWVSVDVRVSMSGMGDVEEVWVEVVGEERNLNGVI